MKNQSVGLFMFSGALIATLFCGCAKSGVELCYSQVGGPVPSSLQDKFEDGELKIDYKGDAPFEDIWNTELKLDQTGKIVESITMKYRDYQDGKKIGSGEDVHNKVKAWLTKKLGQPTHEKLCDHYGKEISGTPKGDFMKLTMWLGEDKFYAINGKIRSDGCSKVYVMAGLLTFDAKEGIKSMFGSDVFLK